MQVLGENVEGIMKRKKVKQAQVAAMAKRAGIPIDQTTVGRVVRAKDPTNKVDPPTLRTIEGLAHGLGVKPWQLLMEDLDIEALVPATAGDTPLSDAQVADVDRARELLAQFTPAQADLFINSDELRTISGLVPHFPVDKMKGNWTGPQAQQVQQPKATYKKKGAS